MNTFDIIAIVIIAFCLIRGLFKGLIGELSGIIGVVAGFYGAYTYYPLISAYAEKWIHNPGIRNLAAFFVLFCIIMILVSLISILIRKFLNLVFLGWVDRAFGLAFGAAKGILIVSVIFIMMTNFIPKDSNIISGSRLSPYIAKISKSMTLFISKNARKDFIKNLEGIL
ncbi:MAG: CvpA family protein [Desulfobacula sp.]|jgi:membrane protein required for colicin V production